MEINSEKSIVITFILNEDGSKHITIGSKTISKALKVKYFGAHLEKRAS